MESAIVREQRRWNPGFDDGARSLGDVYAGMPRDPAGSVPWYVRALENPASPLALGGAVDLFTHDCIHIVLGRGLLPQDEAFVLGFTMGTSRRRAAWHRPLFKACARRLYRGDYRFSPVDAEVFDFGVQAGRCSGVSPLDATDFRGRLARSVAELRVALCVEPALLRAFYAIERRRWPHGPASQRLPRG